MNSIIELHDSTIAEIINCDEFLVVRFSPGYVHRSEGIPGIDPGSGWLQDFNLVISGGMVLSNFTEFPQKLDTGSLRVENDYFENEIPLGFNLQKNVQFSAISINGQTLRIQGNGATIEPIGEASYLEEFPGYL